MSIQHPLTVNGTAESQKLAGVAIRVYLSTSVLSSTIRRLFSLLVLLMLPFLLLVTTQVQADDSSQSKQTLLVLGDSISAGYGLRQGQGWVNLLDKRLKEQGYNTQVINASISGETTQGGLTRLPALLRQHKPDLVLLELGGNDGLRGLPLHLMQNNLSRMIDLTRQAKATPMLLGIQLPPNYGRRYTSAFAAVYPKVAEQKQVVVVPFILEKIAIYPDLMQDDGIHPKAEAQRQLLDNIWPSLKPLLKIPEQG